MARWNVISKTIGVVNGNHQKSSKIIKNHQKSSKIIKFFIFVVACQSFFVHAISDYKPSNKNKPLTANLNFQAQVMTVKFGEDTQFRLRNGKVKPFKMPSSGGNGKIPDVWIQDAKTLDEIVKDFDLVIVPKFSDADDFAAEDKNDEAKISGEKKTGKKLADLNNFFTLVNKKMVDARELQVIVDQLNKLASVEIAYIDSTTTTSTDFSFLPIDVRPSWYPDLYRPSTTRLGKQGYLANNVNGIHAKDGWKWDGGTGNNIKVVAVDDNINPDHIDLVGKPWYGRWWQSISNSTRSDHGTAVAGILFADDNNFGITGIVHDIPAWGFVSATRCVFTMNLCWLDSAYGLNDATTHLQAGDVISMSLGSTVGPIANKGAPAEWHSGEWAATQAAVAKGVVVVVSAGNDAVNLDDPAFQGYFDLSVRDSGAIIVGGTEPWEELGVAFNPYDNSGSNWGSRVSAHSWFNEIATLGYGWGDPNNPNVPADEWFTAGFGGTSGAAPIVAGAAASIQSIRKTMGLAPLNSVAMRDLIRDTGTPQVYDLAKSVGPTPNIHAAAVSMQSEILECDLGSPGVLNEDVFLYNSVVVTNKRNTPISNWTVYLKVGASLTSAFTGQGSNVSSEIKDDFLILRGTTPLAPSASTTFALVAFYEASEIPSPECY